MSTDWDDDEPIRFFRGIRNGCLISIPMWAVIVYTIYLAAGCVEHGTPWG